MNRNDKLFYFSINILTTFYTSAFDDLKNVIVVCIVMSKSSDV